MCSLGMGTGTQGYDDLYFGWTNSFDFNDLASTYYWSGQNPPNTLSLAPDAALDELVKRLWASDSHNEIRSAQRVAGLRCEPVLPRNQPRLGQRYRRPA